MRKDKDVDKVRFLRGSGDGMQGHLDIMSEGQSEEITTLIRTMDPLPGPTLLISPNAAQALGLALHEFFEGPSPRLGDEADGEVVVTWMGDQANQSLQFSCSEVIHSDKNELNDFAHVVSSKVSPLSPNGVATLAVADAGWQWFVSTTSTVGFGPQIADSLSSEGL